MKKSLFGILFFGFLYGQDQLNFVIHAPLNQAKKIKLGLVMISEVEDKQLEIFTSRLTKDLEWSDQCFVISKKSKPLTHQKDIIELFIQDDLSLVIFVSKIANGFTWRLYDLLSGAHMIKGQKIEQKDKTIQLCAHQVADQLWPILMNVEGCFSSKIAYCKQVWKKKGKKDKSYKQIWIADFDGSNEKLFIDLPTVSFAPRWNNNVQCPLLFYSENTLSNIQLVMSNMFSKRKIICQFDGLNMQPTFSSDSKKIVFCLSKDGSSQLYLSYLDDLSLERKFTRLTHNDRNNISPCFIDDWHVVFVSDFETIKPQLYIMNLSDKSLKRITHDSYCACPSYCKANHKIVYSKMIGSGMQLFVYDCQTEKHSQITFGQGSKEEASWSVCGNYINFGLNEGMQSKIAQLNLITGKIKVLSAQSDHCTYPASSPKYEEIIGILKN